MDVKLSFLTLFNVIFILKITTAVRCQVSLLRHILSNRQQGLAYLQQSLDNLQQGLDYLNILPIIDASVSGLYTI